MKTKRIAIRPRRGAKTKRLASYVTLVDFDAAAWVSRRLVLAPGSATQACENCGEDIVASGTILFGHTIECIVCEATYVAHDSELRGPLHPRGEVENTEAL